MRPAVTTSAAQQASAPAGPHRGLTEAEAARRLAEHGRNEVAAARPFRHPTSPAASSEVG
ncbi:cation-transporting P-type ATPase [Streptomyces goshikiensis]|uniref:cation-transporting P-type ATPase n=1 Tax=Streptomyces goshikiensis TaxID=1942 RepID=UPI0036BEF67D